MLWESVDGGFGRVGGWTYAFEGGFGGERGFGIVLTRDGT